MTYLQLMIKCLKFFKDQIEAFEIYDFYQFWLGNVEDDMDSYYKSKTRKALMYLILLESQKCSDVDNPLLNLLEKELAYYDISLCKTVEKTEEKINLSITENPYMLDQINKLELEELSREEQTEIISELFSELKKQMPNNWEVEQYESAIHTVMEMVSQIIPELFFTEKGYKYIDKNYQIEDPELRYSCYQYIKLNIQYYNRNRIYKVDENIYGSLYELEEVTEEYDEFYGDYEDEESLEPENIFLDVDERGQVDIYDEDIDNYDILFYAVTLLIVLLKFIKNQQYDKLKRMIEIDDVITNYYNGYSSEYDKTLIEAIYQPKTMEPNFNREISHPLISDFYLDFFLSNNKFTQQYNIHELSLIISHCFDFLDNEPIKKIIKSSSTINNVFSTTDLDNQEEMIKKLVRIKKDIK